MEEGSLYPALQRMQVKGRVMSEWKSTPTRRWARYYRLTSAGRRQLGIEAASFSELVRAIDASLVGVTLGTAVAPGVSRLLRSQLYGVSATDPVSLAAAAVLLVVVVGASAWIAAARASRLDPRATRRAE